jgi:hypothetical protein
LGNDGQKIVARGVFCVEYFPYHSKTFGAKKLRVASQKYGFALVRRAMRRRAIIVVMRAEKLWRQEISGLCSYKKLYFLNSPRNTTISRNNCRGFGDLVKTLSEL